MFAKKKVTAAPKAKSVFENLLDDKDFNGTEVVAAAAAIRVAPTPAVVEDEDEERGAEIKLPRSIEVPTAQLVALLVKHGVLAR